MQKNRTKDPNESRLSWQGQKVAGALWLAAGMACTSLAQAAGITVEPADGPVSMTGVTVDLDCDDLVVNGTLDATGATFQKVGNVIIGAGGSLTAANATIELTRTWQNSGAFSGAGSTVSASNVCANSSTTFSGSTTFHNFSATVSGLTLNFATGTEQKVAGLLSLGNVTLLGQGGTAYLTLLPGGSQSISAVGVNGVSAARGQHLAPTQTNQISGSSVNWFGTSPVPGLTPVPTVGPAGLALMGLLVGLATFLRRRRGSTGST